MKFNIVLVGCGGTGGCFFGRFIRFMADFYAENTTINLSIMDGDTVELKNLGRQPFVEQDVGENKAVALAMAAEEALGVRVKAYLIYISESSRAPPRRFSFCSRPICKSRINHYLCSWCQG